MKYLLTPVLLLVTACGGAGRERPEPFMVIQEVAVPVKTPCVPKALGNRPVYVDSDAALKSAPDAASRYQLIFAGRGQRIARLKEIEPIVASCPKEK